MKSTSRQTQIKNADCKARCDFLDLPVHRFCDPGTISPTLLGAYSFYSLRGVADVRWLERLCSLTVGTDYQKRDTTYKRTNQHENKVRHQEHRETRTIEESGKSGKYIFLKSIILWQVGRITRRGTLLTKGQISMRIRSGIRNIGKPGLSRNLENQGNTFF